MKSTKLILPEGDGALCVKEIDVCYKDDKGSDALIKLAYPNKAPVTVKISSVVNVYQQYFSILYSDKAKIQGSLAKCLSARNNDDQEGFVNSICTKFEKASDAKFSRLNENFYRYIDARKSAVFEEECLDSNAMFQLTDVVGQIKEDL